MILYVTSLIIGLSIWAGTIYLWLIPDEARWERGLYDYYASTFLEVPFFCFVLGVVLVFLRKHCPNKTILKTTLWLLFTYVLFPVFTSLFLIAMSLLGITGV